MVLASFLFKGINIWVPKGAEVLVIRDLKARHLNGKKGVKTHTHTNSRTLRKTTKYQMLL